MKIAYISPVYFSDVDLSLLPSLMDKIDIDYYMPISNAVHKGAAISIDSVLPINGVIEASNYKELDKLSKIISNVRCFVVNNCCKNLRSIKSFVLSYKLYRHLLQENYDVIHITEFPKIHEWFLYLLRNKIVLTVHDPFPHSCVDSKSISLERRVAFKLLKRFILLNKSQAEEFIKLNKLCRDGVYSSRLSCYDYLHLYDADVLPIPIKKDYILFFGQITSHKGVDDLLEAMTEVHNSLPDLQLVVAGRWKWNYNYKPFEELNYIHILNKFIPDNELATLIRDSKFVVVPYHDATQSGVVMSAFAYNKPCIATNVGGLPEMVIDRKYGRIIEPKNQKELVGTIVELYNHPSERELYSNNISNDYHTGGKSWSYIAGELINIYNHF